MLAAVDSCFGLFIPHQHCAFTSNYVLFGNLSLFASYAMLIRPKQLSTAASIQGHYFVWEFKGVKPATNVAIVPNIVASS